jgi:hypothetical protein
MIKFKTFQKTHSRLKTRISSILHYAEEIKNENQTEQDTKESLQQRLNQLTKETNDFITKFLLDQISDNEILKIIEKDYSNTELYFLSKLMVDLKFDIEKTFSVIDKFKSLEFSHEKYKKYYFYINVLSKNRNPDLSSILVKINDDSKPVVDQNLDFIPIDSEVESNKTIEQVLQFKEQLEEKNEEEVQSMFESALNKMEDAEQSGRKIDYRQKSINRLKKKLEEIDFNPDEEFMEELQNAKDLKNEDIYDEFSRLVKRKYSEDIQKIKDYSKELEVEKERKIKEFLTQ